MFYDMVLALESQLNERIEQESERKKRICLRSGYEHGPVIRGRVLSHPESSDLKGKKAALNYRGRPLP
ncbi:MAG: hypothetical protein PQJ58_14220 [Spirochaetales bacterium]|nr:hypothetical protein [Spirochaetales bacterium]